MSDRIPQPPVTRKSTSKVSPNKTVELSPHRITMAIRVAIDEAKMLAPNQGYWESDILEDVDFNFAVGGSPDVNSVIIDNVRFFRKGTMADTLALEERTVENLIEDEAEISRQRRAAKEAQAGQLRRPDIENYSPKQGPK